MRLTLRTLLAYLDDILEPSQAREIGDKVSESGYASALVDRIREVMRRRRLTAPDLTGPGSGIDPNSVAEYLDNTLPPDAVADVEKVCLDSDVHLAEVAASHQILTIVLGEPVDVPATTRERMYALGPIAPTLDSAEMNGRKPADGKAMPASSETARSGAKSELVPDYLKPAPAWKRYGPVAVGLLVGGYWLALVWGDLGLMPNDKPNNGGDAVTALGPDVADGLDAVGDGTDQDTAGSEPQPEIDALLAMNSEPAAQSGGDGGSPRTGGSTGPGGTEVAAVTPPAPKSFDELKGFDPPAPPDAPAAEPKPSTARMPATTAASRPVSAVPAVSPAVGTPPQPQAQPTATVPPAVTPTTTAPADEPAPQPQDLPLPQIVYTSRDGVMAQAADDGWHVMPHRSLLKKGDRLATPAPFISYIEIDSLDISIQLHGGTVIEVVGASKDEAVILRLVRGNVALRRGPGEPANPVTIGLLLNDELCRLTLQPGNSVTGVSVEPAEPNGFEVELGPNRYIGKLFVVTGHVSFHSELASVEKLSGPAWLPLTPTDRHAIATTAQQSPLLATPEWLAESIEQSPVQRRYGVAFEKGIDSERPLIDSLPALVSENPTLSSFAVQAMSIMEIHSPLIAALAQVEYGDVREVAFHGLRQWLALAPENAGKLRAELNNVFQPDQVEVVYRLLWGYNADDGRNPVTSQMLIDWLSHDNDVIRQLAIIQIYQLTGQRHDYRATNPEKQRRTAIEQFEAFMKKNGGKLVN